MSRFSDILLFPLISSPSVAPPLFIARVLAPRRDPFAVYLYPTLTGSSSVLPFLQRIRDSEFKGTGEDAGRRSDATRVHASRLNELFIHFSSGHRRYPIRFIVPRDTRSNRLDPALNPPAFLHGTKSVDLVKRTRLDSLPCRWYISAENNTTGFVYNLIGGINGARFLNRSHLLLQRTSCIISILSRNRSAAAYVAFVFSGALFTRKRLPGWKWDMQQGGLASRDRRNYRFIGAK